MVVKMTKMKKSHILVLAMALVLAATSAYSLAAINQVYNIGFDWYSQYQKSYISGARETSLDTWQKTANSPEVSFRTILNRSILNEMNSKAEPYLSIYKKNDFNKYILLDCTMGKVYSPNYRIKVTGIAQRGNVVEVMVSLNSPAQTGWTEEKGSGYIPRDLIRINRSSFSIKGRLNFIFKSQDGIKLFEAYYDIV
jgi:hypothetical protein